MKSICGTNCEECNMFNNKCNGCLKTNGCPFGKKCFVADYIEIGGKENFEEFKKQLISEFNSLKIETMPEIKELYPLNGMTVNIEQLLPNGVKTKILNDNEIYLGNQVECEFNDKDIKRYFGIVANTDFLLVCEYGENYDSQIILFKKR